MAYMYSLLKSLIPFALKATFVMLLVLVTAVLGSSVFFHQLRLSNSQAERQMSVQGSSTRKVTPDSARVTLGKNMRGTDIVGLQTAATISVNDLISSLRGMGIEDKQIRTSRYNLNPVYADNGDIRSYALNISVEITLEETDPKADMTAKVIAAGTENGIDEVRGLSFYLSNQDELQKELENEAIADAKVQAEKRAEASGIRLGGVKNVYTSGGYYPMPYSGISTPESGRAVSDSATKQLDIQAGEFDLESQVTLIYEIL